MSKLTIRCLEWRPLCRRSLRGHAVIVIAEFRLIVRDIGIHTRDGKTWCQLPSRPWMRNGQLVTGDDGKPRYSPVFEFESAKVWRAFSDAVVAAVLRFEPRALECAGETS
jgi:hypothetical protein